MNTHKIILGDCITGMKTLPDGCVQTCITSPPYFGLRDYGGGDSEIGQEDTVEGYVQKMVEVFREVRRILRDDGTLWLNLGDSYMSAKNCAPPPQTQGGQRGMPSDFVPANRKDQKGLKTKDLIGIPWRVAFALQADGWYLRQDIIWNKPNPMPESVEDRCTKAHEYIFLLSKKPHYYYDHEAVKEPARNWGTRDRSEMRDGTTDPKLKHHGLKGKEWEDNPLKNKRSVWTVNAKGYKGAHFAVYPEDLIMPCVLAGTSAHGCCSKCGAPYIREVEVNRTFESGSGKSGNMPEGKHGSNLQGGGETKDIRRGPICHSKTIGWGASCDCQADISPCVVFDPFTGSGTTAVVALKNGRNYIGTELNPEYVKIAEDRIKESVPQTLSDFLA
jgi:DNA modification methylase